MRYLFPSRRKTGYTTLYEITDKLTQELLYVGVTDFQLWKRMNSHKKFNRHTMDYKALMFFPTRELAEGAETALILSLRPPLNEASGARTKGVKQSAEQIKKKTESRAWYSNTDKHNLAIGVANGMSVRCVETGDVFYSMSEAARWCGSANNAGKISECVSGKRNTHKGYHWELVDKALVGEILPETTFLIQGKPRKETILSEA